MTYDTWKCFQIEKKEMCDVWNQFVSVFKKKLFEAKLS